MAELQLYNLNYTHNVSENYKKLLTLSGFVLLESTNFARGVYTPRHTAIKLRISPRSVRAEEYQECFIKIAGILKGL